MWGRKKRPVRPALAPPPQETMYPWGGIEFLPSELAAHFAVMGMAGTGKTLSIRMLMAGVLLGRAKKLRYRALVYDPKRDFYPILVGLGVAPERIHMLHPFDERGSAWDLAKDVPDSATARQLASILLPPDRGSNNPFFSQAAFDLAAGVIDTLRIKAPGNWTLNDLLQLLLSPGALRSILSFTGNGRSLKELYLEGSAKTAADVLSTVRSKVADYLVVGQLWGRSRTRLSLTEWARSTEPSILLLGTDLKNAATLDPINRAVFKRVSELVTGRPEENPADETWFFLDEVRRAGELNGIQDLLLLGRSKGAHVVLGFQDIQGLRHVYGREQADELVGQCGNLAVLKLNNPETMAWAAAYFGRYEEVIASYSESITHGRDSSSRTEGTSWSLVERPTILDQEFRLFALPSESGGVTGAFAFPERAWRGTVPADFISAYLRALSQDPGFLPRPTLEQEDCPLSAQVAGLIEAGSQFEEPPLPGGEKRLRTLDEP